MFHIPKRLISRILRNKGVSNDLYRISSSSFASPPQVQNRRHHRCVPSSSSPSSLGWNTSFSTAVTPSLHIPGLRRSYASSAATLNTSSLSRYQSTISSSSSLNSAPSSASVSSSASSSSTPTATASSLSSISSMRRVVNLLCVDATGNVTEVRMPITQLKSESHLHMRELLIVEQPARGIQPRILPRRHCIVMTIGIVRAIIFTDRVYLFNSRSLPGVNEYAQALANHLLNQRFSNAVTEYGTNSNTGNGSSTSITNNSTGSNSSSSSSSSSSPLGFASSPSPTGNASTSSTTTSTITVDDKELTPFEIQVMEHVLLSQVLKAARRVTHLRRLLERQLARMVTVERDDGNLAALFPLANTVTHFELVTRGLGECIRDLLDDDRDMREACLTEKKRNIDAIRSDEEEKWKNSTMESMDHDGELNDFEITNNNSTGTDNNTNLSSLSPSFSSKDYPSSSSSKASLRSLTSAELLSNERPRLRNADNDEDNESLTLRLRSRSGNRNSNTNSMGSTLSSLPSSIGSAGTGRGSGAHRSANSAFSFDKKDPLLSHRTHHNHFNHHNHHSRAVLAAEKEEQDRVLDISPDALSQLELMLESVYHMAAETNMLLVEMGRTVRAKQDLLELQQSNYRNWILSATLRMTVLSVSFTTATFITSAFGQNLLTGLENIPGLFYLVTGGSGVVGYSIYRYIDHHTLNSSPTRPIGQRLEALTDFVYTMDAKVAAAQTVLMQAAARKTTASTTDDSTVKGNTGTVVSNPYNYNVSSSATVVNNPTNATTESTENDSFSLPQFLSSPRLFSHEYAPALASDTFTTAYGGTNSTFATANNIGEPSGNGGAITSNGGMDTGSSGTGGLSSSSASTLHPISSLNDSVSASSPGLGSGSTSSVHPRARRSIDAGANLSAMRNRYLTKTEFKVAYERLVGKPVTLQEIDILFDVFDQDSDGRLKLDEVLDMVAIRGSNTNSSINNILTNSSGIRTNPSNGNGGGNGTGGGGSHT